MLLTDDPERTVIEPLAREKAGMEQVYDFDLMERGGHLAGWKLGREQLSAVAGALQALADPAAFNARYGTQDQPVLLFAVGDGNHSLATAKECYERQKRITPQDQWETLPSPVRPGGAGQPPRRVPGVRAHPPGGLRRGAGPGALRPAHGLPRCPGGEGDGHVIRYLYGNARGPSPSLTPPPSWRWEPFSPSWTGGWRGGPASAWTISTGPR